MMRAAPYEAKSSLKVLDALRARIPEIRKNINGTL
jgi:hypothetical protein